MPNRPEHVVYSEDVGGWVVSGRELAVEVMRDSTRFTVDDPRFSTAQVVGPSMLSNDGAEHRRHRDPFAGSFRPAEVMRRYADETGATARALVAALAPRGEAELRRELAGPLAVAVVAMSLGLAHLDPVELLGWYDEIVAAVEGVSVGEPVGSAARRSFEELGAAIDEAVRRPDSVLLAAAAVLSRDEVIANAAVFLFGGIETSEGMTADLLHHLLSNPAQLDRIRDDRRLLDAAVEESLRLEPAAARVDRYATADLELAGVQIRMDDLVVVSISAANRDPAVFERPDEFDPTRVNVRTHVSFAQGPHACLGAQLARLETRAAVDAVLDLLPGIELSEPTEVVGVIFRKPRAVQAAWTAVPT